MVQIFGWLGSHCFESECLVGEMMCRFVRGALHTKQHFTTPILWWTQKYYIGTALVDEGIHNVVGVER